jgi:hypothetical protein
MKRRKETSATLAQATRSTMAQRSCGSHPHELWHSLPRRHFDHMPPHVGGGLFLGGRTVRADEREHQPREQPSLHPDRESDDDR